MSFSVTDQRTETEHLALAMLVALVLHALVITQLHFDWFDSAPPKASPNLDVVLVEWASESEPEQADFLAQANQVGGGDNTDVERPSAPPTRPPSEAAEDAPDPAPQIATAPQTPQDLLATQGDAALSDPLEPPAEPLDSPPNARELLRQARALTQVAPDTLADRRSEPRRPRRKFITANTRAHLYAGYMRNWVAKVERVGNMNYPEEARQRNLEGSLVLSVDVLADGSVERIQILRSSGYDILDEAAVRIVRLASPYAELPPDIRAETDILVITRTWEFSSRTGLR